MAKEKSSDTYSSLLKDEPVEVTCISCNRRIWWLLLTKKVQPCAFCGKDLEKDMWNEEGTKLAE